MGCCISHEPSEIEDSRKKSNYPNSNEIDLSHFVLQNVLGQGGFGVVRVAKKLSGPDKGQLYAIKCLSKKTVLQRSSGPSSVLTELQALALLDSPFISNSHYAFQNPVSLFLVVDLALGGDLRYNLKYDARNKFSEDRAKFYIAQVLLALDSCHKNNILHRDVKPENLLLKENGYIMLTDFGIAKILPNIEDCRSTSGTHGYMVQ